MHNSYTMTTTITIRDKVEIVRLLLSTKRCTGFWGADRKRGKKKYGEMSSSMAAAGCNRSHTQIKNKMRAMTSAYNDINSNHKRSGYRRNRETFAFYKEMHMFLGGRPTLNPSPGLVIKPSRSTPSTSNRNHEIANTAVLEYKMLMRNSDMPFIP